MKTAVIAANGLGDGLIMMVIANNLKLAGQDVTCFSSPLCGLKSWFPQFKIEPFPIPEGYKSIFSKFDRLIVADHACIKEEHNFGNAKLILKESSLNRRCSMVDNLTRICRTELGIDNPTKNNGIKAPSTLHRRAYPNRVIIHPMSTSEKKNWYPEKYIDLCYQLSHYCYEPIICVSPKERGDWIPRLRMTKLALPTFNTLSDLAAFVYESGGMIGNDSGVGHLASCLKLPTFSLFARKSYAHLWRPGWGENTVITPPPLLLGAPLKEKFWKNLISPKKVMWMYKQKVGPR